MADAEKTITLEMGLTPKVFDDTLPNASQPYTIKTDGNHYMLTLDQRTITIQHTELAPRVIAGLSLPVTRIELHFRDHTAQQIDSYMERFMKYFHRGGG